MRERVASDLDGTVRQSLEPFNSWRDLHPNGTVRKFAGYLAAAFAKRINPHIDADVYITGSPAYEDKVTKLWLWAHGLATTMHGNPAVDRGNDIAMPNDTTSATHKIDIINSLGIAAFYEDNHTQGQQIATATGVEVRYVS